MTELVAFLRARHSREWDNVQLISSGGYAPDIWKTPQQPWPGLFNEVECLERLLDEPTSEAYSDGDGPVALVRNGRNQHLHVATYDPQRIADELDAKMRIVDWVVQAIQVCEDDCYNLGVEHILRLLALPYADHPDYDPEWAPTAR